MSSFWDQVIAALIGAVVGGIVNLFFEYIKEILKVGSKQDKKEGGAKSPTPTPNRRKRLLIYIFIGLVVGSVTWSLIYPQYQKTLFTFDSGPDSWVPLSNPNDAAWKTDEIAKALVAQYNFAQTGSTNPDPRATFYYDNFNDTWLGYETFNLDITNPGSEHLEMTLSVEDMDGCFHEFGKYRNLSPGDKATISFNFTEPRFKTCEAPDKFDQPLDTTKDIRRIYLIIGTNVKPADFDGQILIDNIRLNKDPFWFRLLVAGVVLLTAVAFTLIEYRLQKRDGSARKGDSHAKSKA